MHNKFLLAVISCFVSIFVYSQPNIRPGYIIDTEGDTIKGYIDYRDWQVNPRTIQFSRSDTGTKITCTPISVRGFGVEGNIYISQIVQHNIRAYRIEDLNYTPTLLYTTDTVFLKALVLGEKSLYSYYDKVGRDHFYIGKGNNMELLVYQRYLKKSEDQSALNVIMSNNKYVGQLILYLNDCASLKPQIERAEYTGRSLIGLFNSYYKCMSIPVKYVEPEGKSRSEAGAFAGLCLTKLVFKGGAVPHLSKASFPMSASFTAGLFYNLVLSKSLQRLSLNNELQYSHYKTDGIYNDFISSTNYTTIYSKFGFDYLRLNNMIRYTALLKDVYCFIEAGMSNGYAIGIENYKRTEHVFYSSKTIEEGHAVDGPRKYEQSWLLGFGAKYERFSISYRVEQSNGMSDYSWLSSDVTRQYILFAYKIK